MDDERFAAATRGADMSAETLALPLGRVLVPVIVEAGLADRDHLGMAGEFQQLFETGLVDIVAIGMHPDRGEQVVVALGQAKHRGQGFELYAHAQRVRHLRNAHRLEHFGFARDEIGKIEVAVGIDEHRSDRMRRPVRAQAPGQHLFDAAAHHLAESSSLKCTPIPWLRLPWASAGVIQMTEPATGILAGSSINCSSMKTFVAEPVFARGGHEDTAVLQEWHIGCVERGLGVDVQRENARARPWTLGLLAHGLFSENARE